MTSTYAFAGTTMTVLVSGEQTQGAFSILHVTKPSGSSTPPHSHDRETELSFVLSGELSVETEGRVETFATGDFIRLPPGRPHRLFNKSGETVREFLLCVPAMFDSFVAAAGRLVSPLNEPEPMTADDRRRLVEAAPCFGVRLLRSAQPDRAAVTRRVQPREQWEVPGACVELLCRFGENDGDLVLMRARLEPGFNHPPLGLADGGSVFVVRGAVDHYEDGSDWRSIRPDAAVYLHPGRRHAFRNMQDVQATLLIVATGRMAGFVGEASALLPRSAAPDTIPTLVAIAARYGVGLMPPTNTRLTDAGDPADSH